MRHPAQTSIRRLAGVLFLGLPLLLAACGGQPTAPVSSGPVLEPAVGDDLGYSELITQCLIEARERLVMEVQRHRTAVLACNGDRQCLAVEVELNEALVQEIRREYIDCRRIGH